MPACQILGSPANARVCIARAHRPLPFEKPSVFSELRDLTAVHERVQLLLPAAL